VRNQTFELPVARSGLRFYPIGDGGEGFVARVTHDGGFRTITLQTVVEARIESVLEYCVAKQIVLTNQLVPLCS
jgi:hypothetical protein